MSAQEIAQKVISVYADAGKFEFDRSTRILIITPFNNFYQGGEREMLAGALEIAANLKIESYSKDDAMTSVSHASEQELRKLGINVAPVSVGRSPD